MEGGWEVGRNKNMLVLPLLKVGRQQMLSKETEDVLYFINFSCKLCHQIKNRMQICRRKLVFNKSKEKLNNTMKDWKTHKNKKNNRKVTELKGISDQKI